MEEIIIDNSSIEELCKKFSIDMTTLNYFKDVEEFKLFYTKPMVVCDE